MLTRMLEDLPLQTCQLADGRTQAWRESGKSSEHGQTLVLLHGISSGSGSWVQQLAALGSAERKVMAWDAPGYGGSDELATTRPSALDYAERLASWLESQGVERCWLVGHSLGAMIASAFARRYPQRLSGLLLASPAQGYGKADAQTREQVFRKRPDVLQQLGPEGLAQKRAAALVSPNASADQVALVADGMKKLRLAGFTAASWLLANDDIWSYLPVDSEPRRVICGGADDITPPTAARQLALDFGATEFVEIPAAGHACYIEAADQVNQVLLEWLSTTVTATSRQTGSVL
ncbi:alpha/beta fold hydrolase [Oceanobacter mangrovi]|uniref:alpha/beta fold hydrolase n=1 Tax=Oceanobacter mangrovi TaxID=2862510 RepID=UPI001C8D2876|nr:alpha/beta hydrolase [Oceanobacter mangrovi]